MRGACQVQFARKDEAVTYNTIRLCIRIKRDLLSHDCIWEQLMSAESLTVQGLDSPFDGFSKLAAIASKCNSKVEAEAKANRS